MQGDKYEELLDELANALDEEELNAVFPWFDDDDDEMTGCGYCLKDCDGKDSSGKCPKVCDSEECGENKKCCQEKKCECGAASCGSSAHSSYCPLYES